MTPGKELTMNNMVHASNIQKFKFSFSLLSMNEFKLVFQSNKYIFTKSRMLVDKVYLCDKLLSLMLCLFTE